MNPDPYDCRNVCARQTTQRIGPREDRYRPIRSNSFIDRLHMAKRE